MRERAPLPALQVTLNGIRNSGVSMPIIIANSARAILVGAMFCVGLAVASVERSRAQGAGLDAEFELVDPKVLRVCADPNNLPFSNEKGEGFENKIMELMAAKLDKKLAYVWYPQATGFVRNTLGARRCDVIPGFPQ